MENELNIYQKVAQLLINVRTNKPREIICRALVIAILADEKGELGVEQVVERIKKRWKLKVPPRRVRKGLESLANNKDVKKQAGRYSMNDQQKERYRQSVKNRVSFFEEVEQDWIESMQRIKRCRKLSESEREIILQDFRTAIDVLCDTHGDRIANFLSGAANELKQTFISEEIVDYIPQPDGRPQEILEIEKHIFPLFFQSADERRAKYVSGLAQAYLRRTIFKVETEGHNIFEARMKSINVYLDTNMIFALLGLHGLAQQDFAERILVMHRTLGINTLVDQRSIKEFKSVLANSKRDNIGPRIPKQIFPEVKKVIMNPRYKPDVAFALPDDDFVLSFWASLDEDFVKTADRKQVLYQWDRFLGHYESVDVILTVKYKVRVVRKSRACLPGADAFEKTIGLILKAAKKSHSRKTHTTAEHDATMFFLINKLREDEMSEFLPSNYWLLSADNSLTIFHKMMLKENLTALAHFVPVASWIELIMPFLTIQLVDETGDAMLIAKSLGEGFEYFEVLKMKFREVAQVFRRVPESYERAPELILKCAANRHFRETVRSAMPVGAVPSREQIDEAVTRAFDSVKDQADLADRKLIEECDRMAHQTEESKAELEREKARSEKAERRLGQIKLAMILLGPAIGASLSGYFLITPKLPLSIDAGFWVAGIAYLCLWIWLSVRGINATPRSIICTYLVAPLIFVAALFQKHWGNTEVLTILVPVLVAILSVGGYLLKRSWLDVRIMLR